MYSIIAKCIQDMPDRSPIRLIEMCAARIEEKVDRLAGKIYFVQKKTKTPKIMDNFLDMLTLEVVALNLPM